MKILLTILLVFSFTVAKAESLKPSLYAEDYIVLYPWLTKSQGDLTEEECHKAMSRDHNYWWENGKCHMKYIRYASGIMTKDTHAVEDSSTIKKKGELISPTQYRPSSNVYCEHGGYCYSANNVKLLGSIRVPLDTKNMTGDKEIDSYQNVVTSCEVIVRNRAK